MISPEKGLFYGIFSIFIFYYLLLIVNEKLFVYVVTFIVVTLSLYYPIYLLYGSLNSGIVAAFLETNLYESFSFTEKFDVTDFLFPAFFIYSFILLMRLKKYRVVNTGTSDRKQKVLHGVLVLVLLLSIFWVPVKYYFSSQNQIDKKPWTLSDSPVNVLSFYFNIYDSIKGYYVEKQELELAAKALSPWHVVSFEPKYKNYILVIGESARRDYFSAYGFKLNTSPFLAKTTGYVNRGYISAAPATYHSLLHSLYFVKDGQKKIDYAYNIINLAKSANIKTTWISNQGSIGKYDTISSRIGVSSDNPIFTKKGGFNMTNVDDSKLIEILSHQLKETSDKDRVNLFVLHLMGSHNNFCDRLIETDEKLDFINKDMGCYVSSILKTDRLIESIITMFKEKNESYSLIYFSDHGLAHVEKENKDKLTLDYDIDYKQSYEIPFFKISSDDTERNEVNVKRSAFNFMYGFSQWLGIKTEELNGEYDFFSDREDKNIKVFNFDEMVNFDELKDDPIPANN
ncbi:phosphoethanolamine transferase [Glaesserella sp.]|uniref:phosphoethanolamine transferase n=1 Tax=Glaesserella sp. TaxID=2094731 RepID=UPI00359F741D